MGCCLGRQSATSSSSDIQDFTLGKNRPLSHSVSRWRSEFPLTDGQLRSKRDEFWDTAPAFEGRKEIWDAIRAASSLAEQTDFALAQAILDGAGVSLPNGTLRECYDELGSRYQVPIYCLSKPINLVTNDNHDSSSSPKMSMSSPKPSKNKKKSTLKRPPSVQTIKFRISFNERDIKMQVQKDETVRSIKERLHSTVEDAPSPNMQRWFFGGRYLTDRSTIAQCDIPPGFVVQVVSSTSAQPSPLTPRNNETNAAEPDTNNNPADENPVGPVPPEADPAGRNPGEVPTTSSRLLTDENNSSNSVMSGRKQKKKSKRQRNEASARRKQMHKDATSPLTVTTAV